MTVRDNKINFSTVRNFGTTQDVFGVKRRELSSNTLQLFDDNVHFFNGVETDIVKIARIPLAS